MEYAQLLILRDTSTQIPVTVPAYEVPILQVVHGDNGGDKVIVVETFDQPAEKDAEGNEIPLDQEQAYDNLIGKYGRLDETAVRSVYRNSDALAEAASGEILPKKTRKSK